MKAVVLGLLLIIGVAAAGKGGRRGYDRRTRGRGNHGGNPPSPAPAPAPGQGYQPPYNYYGPQTPAPEGYYRPPSATNTLSGAYLSASPSDTVPAGTSVTLTCDFSTEIYQQLVYFAIGDGVDPDVLVFDTSSIAMGETTMIAEQVGVVVKSMSVSLVFYTTVAADSGVYSCYIPNVATSNPVTLTVSGQAGLVGQASLAGLASCSGQKQKEKEKQKQNKTTLIIAITVPVVVVLAAALIAIVVMRVRYGYRCHGMQFRKMQQAAGGAELGLGEKEKEAAACKPDLDVLDSAKLPPYVVASNAPAAMYEPPCYDEAVYGNEDNAGRNVQGKPGASDAACKA